MNLNFNQLRSFILVADEGNLTRAAERRHTTPSAVSAHIHQLEDRFGVVLFERGGRGMELTEGGARLMPAARRVMAAARDLADSAAQLSGTRNHSVRLGLNAPPEHLCISQLMATSAQGDPPLVVELESSMSERIIEDVINERLDAGFVYGPIETPVLVREPLAWRRVRVAVPGDFTLERLPDDPARRAALPWIWPGVAGCPFRRIMSVILGASEGEANVVTRIDGEESIRALVRAGMGVGLLEERYAQEAAGDGRLRALEPAWDIELGLVYRADRADDAALVALLRALRMAWAGPEAEASVA